MPIVPGFSARMRKKSRLCAFSGAAEGERRDAGLFPEHALKVGLGAEAALLSQLGDAQVGRQQQIFRAVDAQSVQIVRIGGVHPAVEKAAEMARVIVRGACRVAERGVLVKVQTEIFQRRFKRGLWERLFARVSAGSEQTDQQTLEQGANHRSDAIWDRYL